MEGKDFMADTSEVVVHQGRPADETGRLKKEIAVYDLLEKFLPAVEHDYRTVDLAWQEQ